MQVLYANTIDKDIAPSKLESNLLSSISNTKKMYYTYLLYLIEVCNYSITYSNKHSNKLLNDNENQFISTKLANNQIIKLITNNKEFNDYVNFNKLHAFINKRIVKEIFTHLISKERYLNYLDKKFTTQEDDKDILRYIIKKILGSSSELDDEMTEYFINIEDDQYYVLISLQKKLKSFESSKESLFLQNFLLLEEKDDVFDFGKNLIAKYCDHEEELVSIIKPKLKNWELDRIAVIDTILLKLAICELKYFSNIPIKVTINEYIDLTKEYSSEKSKDFVNGILDKIMKSLKEKGEIKKQGRGLIN